MDEASDVGVEDENMTSQTPSSGPRTLGGDGVPSRAAPSASSSSAAPKPARSAPPSSRSKKQVKSLRDLQAEASAATRDDSDEEHDQEYFAGGDKSGLAVQEPGSGARDRMQRLLETARRYDTLGLLARPTQLML